MNYNEIEEDVKKMITDIENSSINSMEIEFPNGLKIKMDKGNVKALSAPMPVVAPNSAPTVVKDEPSAMIKQEQENYKEIKSPMVGTFYASSSPKAEPFVKVGDQVSEGDTLCIIEAMKVMNEIKAPVSGKVLSIEIQDGQNVEYDQILMRIG